MTESGTVGKYYKMFKSISERMKTQTGYEVRVPETSVYSWWGGEMLNIDGVIEFCDSKYGFPIVRAEIKGKYYSSSLTHITVLIGTSFIVEKSNTLLYLENLPDTDFDDDMRFPCNGMVLEKMIETALVTSCQYVDSAGIGKKIESRIFEKCDDILEMAHEDVENVRFFPRYSGPMDVDNGANPVGFVMRHSRCDCELEFFNSGTIKISSTVIGSIQPDIHSVAESWKLMLNILKSKEANRQLENL